MNPTVTTITKKTIRTRKTAESPIEESPATVHSVSPKTVKSLDDVFTSLLKTITDAKEEYESLQKQIIDVKEVWIKEQKLHGEQIQEVKTQEEITRKRELELYAYETTLKHRQEEDIFLEKKSKWEKELQSQKDAIAQERKELEELRKAVASFEDEKNKAIKEACSLLQKQLTDQFGNEKKLREQEIKAEKELLAFKITTLTQEGSKQTHEIELLKHSLEEATKQLKDVAVKVIESSNVSLKTTTTQEA